jgi:hypothetical protein
MTSESHWIWGWPALGISLHVHSSVVASFKKCRQEQGGASEVVNCLLTRDDQMDCGLLRPLRLILRIDPERRGWKWTQGDARRRLLIRTRRACA